MQLFSVSHQPSAMSKSPVAALPARPRVEARELQTKPEACGWYDSSFDLASGLEISEQDDDVLYQLCEFCLN